ncbi:GDSL-type esterase/lipase family protein [Butyrivibrio proteoclasticus]|uniref:GDSL-type esterase/lipase family protein n=1 Tax=Butyrivibrio proteoclasticus TaxID=43305 RepID=UPI00068518AC|nr:GDSL-type esterase/lipase family protein [Butyrivibrio proteoclasticus]
MFNKSFVITGEDFENRVNPIDFNEEDKTDAHLALLCGGWNVRTFENEKDADHGRDVHILKCEVPSYGTYRVDVKVTPGNSDVKGLCLFTGRRNIVLFDEQVKAGSSLLRSFYAAVYPYIPALEANRYEAKDLFVSWTFKGISRSDNYPRIEINIIEEKAPVIWVLGDSTLTDQNAPEPYYPFESCCGWAQTLLRFSDKRAVYNLAHSGMTSECIRADGHYDILKEFISPGDTVVIQFGHNDQKRRRLSAFGGYSDNLKRFVQETRDFGAEPIICSPISRIPLGLTEDEASLLKMDRHYSLLSSYAKACQNVCSVLEVPLVDLHRITFDKWIELGDKARDYFMPGDITHTNEYGALFIGNAFASECDFMNGCKSKEEVPAIPPSEKKVPKQRLGKNVFMIEPPYLDIKDIPEREELVKAFRYGLLDPCVMYLHPYEEMERGRVLMVMCSALHIPGVRPYLKRFADVYVDEWDSGFVQALINEQLIDEKTITRQGGAEMFRPDDSLTIGEFASFLMRWHEKDIAKRNISIEESIGRADKLGLFDKDILADRPVTRSEVYIALVRYMDQDRRDNSGGGEIVEMHPVH